MIQKTINNVSKVYLMFDIFIVKEEKKEIRRGIKD